MASCQITPLKVRRTKRNSICNANNIPAIHDYYFSFVYTMNPNNGSSHMNWPQWTTSKQLMNFYATGAVLTGDDFRTNSYNWITANIAKLHI